MTPEAQELRYDPLANEFLEDDMETTDRSSGKRPASLWVVVGILGVLSTAFFLVQSGYVAGGKAVCSVCKRPLHKAMTYTLLSGEGKKITA